MLKELGSKVASGVRRETIKFLETPDNAPFLKIGARIMGDLALRKASRGKIGGFLLFGVLAAAAEYRALELNLSRDLGFDTLPNSREGVFSRAGFFIRELFMQEISRRFPGPVTDPETEKRQKVLRAA